MATHPHLQLKQNSIPSPPLSLNFVVHPCLSFARFCESRISSIINDEKSVWEPTQNLNWLGIAWNSALGTLEIIDRRITKILNTIDQIIDADYVVSARRLASFTGQIISTGPVVGNIARIMTRHCVMTTLCNDHWDLEFRLDDYRKKNCIFGKKIS